MVCFLLVACFALGMSSTDDPESQERPNILLIVVDDLGCRDLAGEGHDTHLTPNIDRLGSQSVRYQNAYTNGPNCAPSRASIVTGRYTPRHGIFTVGSAKRGKAKDRKIEPPENSTRLNDDEVTVAEVVQKSGYRTGFVGKWHLGEDPTTQGFDKNVAGGTRGHPKSYFTPYKNDAIEDGPEGEYLIDRLASEVVSIVAENEQVDEEPWFLMWCPYAVHTPIQAPEEDVESFKKRHPGTTTRKAKYAVMVERTDRAVGTVLDALVAHEEYDDTIVIFLSDNGGHGVMTSHAPYRGSKGMLYEGGVRTPLYIRVPGSTPGEIKTPVMAHDIFPTIIEFAGAKSPVEHDGVSLAGSARGEGLERGPIFWHFPAYLEAYNRTGEAEAREPKRPFRTTPVGAMRDGQWKLLEYFEDGGIELYDLQADPGESQNLAESESQIASRMLTQLQAWRDSVNAPMPEPVEK